MTIESPQVSRETELEATLVASQADLAAGRFVEESAAEHIARLKAMLLADQHTGIE